MKKKKITKNSKGYVIITDDKDNFIVAIPSGQYIHLYECDNDAIYITDALSGINRVMIQTSEISEVFGNPFSGNRDALVKLLVENFNSGSSGGGLDPKAYDLADFKNGSSNTFVRKSDLANSAGVQSIASVSTFVTIDNTDPKNPKLKNPKLKNADGDATFNKQLVVNSNGVIGTKSENTGVNTIKKIL